MNYTMTLVDVLTPFRNQKKDWLVKHISHVDSNRDDYRCPHCHSKIVLHKKGRKLPPHFEHKNEEVARELGCPFYSEEFEELGSLLERGKKFSATLRNVLEEFKIG